MPDLGPFGSGYTNWRVYNEVTKSPGGGCSGCGCSTAVLIVVLGGAVYLAVQLVIYVL